MSTLKYPADLDTSRNDYIKFRHFKYDINQNLGTNPGAYPPQRGDGNSIILYMPNTTPATEYGQDAKYQTFAGPLGEMVKNAATALGSPNNSGRELGRTFGNLLTDIQNSDIPGAGQQAALDFIGGSLGFDAATAIALGQQKAYNPNAEMIYNQPLHRKFALTFNFVPKSREDARMVDAIIYEFKRWSAPAIPEGSNFLEIPDLWVMTYFEAGERKYRRMNLFKPAMITNVGVQDNSSSNFHITIKDDQEGHVPVQTALAITLQETMPPTRNDHEWAVANGYKRGL